MIYEWHLSSYFLEGVIFGATSLPLIITGYAQIFLLYLIPFIRYSDRTTWYRKAYNLSLFHFTFLFLLHDFRMIIEWRPSFACHFDNICSSSVLPLYPSMALFLLALKRVYHSCCFHPVQTRFVLRSVLGGLSAMGICHGIVSRIATLPDHHQKFSNLLHVLFPAKPHHFSAAKVVCGAHIVYGLQGVLRIGQWFYENLPFSFLTPFHSCHCQQKEYLQKMPWRTLPSALLWLHL